ncbi:MAG: hypothetical protein HY650_16760 [Acidobacteria bacterium]|nr:hypothetical protein [Acidobacteriota bacterium]
MPHPLRPDRLKKLMTLSVQILGILFLFFPGATESSVISQSRWGQIWGPVGTVVLGWVFPDPNRGNVVYGTNLPEGDIYVYNGVPLSWTKIGGPGETFVTVGNALYALAPDGTGIWMYMGTPGQWTQVGGPAREIYGGLAGLFATDPQTGDIYAYNCACGGSILPGWTKLGGPGKMFAVGAQYLYGLSPDGSGVSQFDFAAMRWAGIGGAAVSIYAGGDNLYATNPQSGDIYEYNHATGEWTKIGGPGKMFAVDQVTGGLYALSPDGSAVYKYTGTPGQWMNIGGAATSIYAGWPNLYATSPSTLNLWEWDNAQAYAQSQTAWNQLPTITSYTTPALSGHSDGRVYVVAVAFNGLMAYTSTVSPGGWVVWQIIGPAPAPFPDPAFYFDSNTPPVLARDASALYLFARGKNNNLYETHKAGINNWSSWRRLTDDARVQGRFAVALTRLSGILDIHVVYTSENNTVTYRRFDSNWNQVGLAEQWNSAREGVVATDGMNEVWAAIRTNDRRLLIEKKTPPWTSFWQSETSRLADRPQGEFFNISNAVYFGGAFHVAYAIKYLCDDVSGRYCHTLAHTRVRSGKADDGYVRFIADYTPQGNEHPQAELILYRNKLVMAYKDHQGWIRYARWDNVDPTTPWIGRGIIGWASTHQHPALGTLNRRPFLSGNDYATSNFGHDLFAVVNDSRNNGLLWFINFSRAIFHKDINPQLYVYTYDLNAGCPPQTDPNAPTLVPDITQLGWPFFSELGYNFWTLPNWLAGSTGNSVFREGPRQDCLAGRTDNSGRFGFNSPRCDTAKYVVIVKPDGGIYVCSGAWVNRGGDYLHIWEELGHPLGSMLGLKMNSGDPNTATQAKAGLTGIPLAVLQQASNIFAQGVNDAQSCQLGTASGGRCRGFTGTAGNYDAGTEQHSFIYALYYYVSDGDQLRDWMKDDLANGVTLLRDKYDWIKQYIFKGEEFKKDNEPVVN